MFIAVGFISVRVNWHGGLVEVADWSLMSQFVIQITFNHAPVFQVSRQTEAVMAVIADDNREKETQLKC